MNNFHFFVTCVFGWATAETREAAIEKLVNNFRQDIKPTIKNCHKDGIPGFYLWSARVNCAADEPYKIEWFAPVGVETEQHQEHAVTYLTEKKMAHCRTYEGERNALVKAVRAAEVTS